MLIQHKKLFWLVAGLGLLGVGFSRIVYSAEPDQEKSATSSMEFRIVAIRYEGTVLWIPSTLIVKKGQKVKIQLINNVPVDPNQHGFAIEEFKIKEVVERGKPVQVEFKADKEGLFRIYCHLHPAHIGGQLLVVP